MLPNNLRTSAAHVASALVARSGVTHIDVSSVDDLGQFGEHPYERVRGFVYGEVAPDEPVVGLGRYSSPFEYSSEFEILQPVDASARSVVVVDVENRGGASVLNALTGCVAQGLAPSQAPYPVGMTPRCVFDTGLSYARVQWQTEHCASVPDDAQGIGLVIVRDFGRHLAGDFARRVIAGSSQSAWFVNTLLAEGFNIDPVDGSGVFHGAFAALSAGNWLALNRLADDGAPQYPYVRPSRSPLTADEILRRPDSDPLYVDITSYTEYYRLRGSVFASSPLPVCARHYDIPAAHGPDGPGMSEVAFERFRCNGGVETPLNPIPHGPYVRALLTRLALDPDTLPPSASFDLGPAPEPSEHFNALPGTTLLVPLVDDDAQPIAGLRVPDVELPTGRAEPVTLAPCGADSIDDMCGNFGGWAPFDGDELARRYGTVEEYGARYAAIVDRLIGDGFILERDRDAVIDAAKDRYGARS
jgi:hypothetical protein